MFLLYACIFLIMFRFCLQSYVIRAPVVKAFRAVPQYVELTYYVLFLLAACLLYIRLIRIHNLFVYVVRVAFPKQCF